MNMLGKIAGEIARRTWHATSLAVDQHDKLAEEVAAAVLAALHDPTPEMIEAAPQGWHDPVRGWQAMLAAAKDG